MSNQRSIEQKRAAMAWEQIQAVKGKTMQEEYGSLVKKAPADIQSNGLGQTLAFWYAKGYEKGDPKSDSAHYHLLQHLTAWLKSPDSMGLQSDNLTEWITKTAQVTDYRRATTEAIAFLVWLKRFAEAELS